MFVSTLFQIKAAQPFMFNFSHRYIHFLIHAFPKTLKFEVFFQKENPLS